MSAAMDRAIAAASKELVEALDAGEFDAVLRADPAAVARLSDATVVRCLQILAEEQANG